MIRWLASFLLAICISLPARAAEFDHYVLALSWSPSFCAQARNADEGQCVPGRRFAFVVHGLWPQNRDGWPEFCAPSGQLPQSLIEANLDIMPAKALIIHQWRKHGTCTGLAPAQYFRETRRRFDGLHIPARYLAPSKPLEVRPAELVNDFVKTNPGLKPEMLLVDCGNRSSGRARLQELRICMGRDGGFVACSDEARSCQAETLVLPPVR